MIGNMMIGILAICGISLYGREYTVPVYTQMQQRHAYQAYIDIERTSCCYKEPITFSCVFSAPADRVTDVKLGMHGNYSGLYIYPQPHIADDGLQRTWTWTGVWYPDTTGVCAFPYLCVTYTYERQRKGRAGMSTAFFAGLVQEGKQMELTGSGTLIHVQPLSVQPHTIDGIGNFSCYWSYAPSQVTVGETYEVCVTVSGTGNLHDVAPPALTPQEHLVSFYLGDDMQHPAYAYQRTFRYAFYVQSPGWYTLSLEPMYMYDTSSDEVYQCAPSVIEIQAQGADRASVQAEETPLPDEQQSALHAEPEQQHNPEDRVSAIRSSMIPFSFLIMLVISPLAIAASVLGVRGMRRYRERHRTYYRVKRAFYNARALLKEKDPERAYIVYQSCMLVFHALSWHTGMTNDIVEEHIRYYAPDTLNAWREAWHHVQTCAFEKHEYIDRDIKQQLLYVLYRVYYGWKKADDVAQV